MNRVGRAAVVAAVAVGSVLSWLGLSPTAESVPRWASAASATIRPGAVMVTDGAQCSANFVFTRGTEVFLGYAAHCAGLGGVTDLDGCKTPSLPRGTRVEIEGATRPGVLVYSSWIAMQQVRERNPSACAHNDFALVRIHPRDVARVNPSMPHWGGPTGLHRKPLPSGAPVFTYGSSSLRLGTTLLSPKSGSSNGTTSAGWSHPVYTISPSIQGDSGSGLLDGSGRAAGVLSSVNITPQPLSNSFGDLQHELAYARVHGMGDVRLAVGTEPFDPNRLPLG
jgi:hypothetical protein